MQYHFCAVPYGSYSVESSLQVVVTSFFFAQSRPSDSHNIRKIANVGHKTTYIYVVLLVPFL